MPKILADSKSILDYYERRLRGHGRGGWATVSHVLGVSIGAAYEIAHGHRPLSDRQALVWSWWVEHEEQMPELTDAIVCPTCGQLHQVDDCHGVSGEPVILPAGARVVQSKPASSKPRRERTQIDMTKCVRAGWQPDELRDIADALEPYAGRLSALDVRILLARLE